MPFVERDGFALHYETAGTGDETIVLTHGLGLRRTRPGARRSSRSRRTIASSPGICARMALRARPTSRCTIAALAADLAAVARAAGNGPVHALGHSAGGVITMRFGIDHPELDP